MSGKKTYTSKYARTPKPESKVQDIARTYYAYGPDGVFQGEVRLTHTRKKQYEEKGFTFKPRF